MLMEDSLDLSAATGATPTKKFLPPGEPGGSDWSWRWGSGGPGVQGLRGVPESNGKVTSKGTAVACLVLAALLVGWAAAAPYVMWGP